MYGNKRASLTKGNHPNPSALSHTKEVVSRGDATQVHRCWCGIFVALAVRSVKNDLFLFIVHTAWSP